MGFFSGKNTPVQRGSNELQRNIDIIQSFLKQTGTSMGFVSTASVKAVAQQLGSSENPLYAVFSNVAIGKQGGRLSSNSTRFKNKTAGIIVITNRRILFCTKVLGDTESVSVQLSDIGAIDMKGSNLTGSTLRLQSRDTALSIDGKKATIDTLRQAIDDALLAANQQISSFPPVVQASSGADEILKYKALYDQGIITEEEFLLKKKQLLGL